MSVDSSIFPFFIKHLDTLEACGQAGFARSGKMNNFRETPAAVDKWLLVRQLSPGLLGWLFVEFS